MVYFFHQYKKKLEKRFYEATNRFKVVFHYNLYCSSRFCAWESDLAHREQKSPWKSAYIRLQMAMFWNAFVSVVVWQELLALFLEGFLEWIKKPQHFNRPPCESNSRKHLACISGFYVGDKLQSCKHNMRTNSKSFLRCETCWWGVFSMVFLMCLKGSERGYLLRWQMSYVVCYKVITTKTAWRAFIVWEGYSKAHSAKLIDYHIDR